MKNTVSPPWCGQIRIGQVKFTCIMWQTGGAQNCEDRVSGTSCLVENNIDILLYLPSIPCICSHYQSYCIAPILLLVFSRHAVTQTRAQTINTSWTRGRSHCLSQTGWTLTGFAIVTSHSLIRMNSTKRTRWYCLHWMHIKPSLKWAEQKLVWKKQHEGWPHL